MISTSVKSNEFFYRVRTGKNILESELQNALRDHATDQLFLIVDQNVANHHQDYINQAIQGISSNCKQFTLTEGESSKSFSHYSKVLDFLLSHGVRRNTPLIVIGGGVTGDLGGFAAATVLRGIPLIHIPTTLLSMVDSAIGGKTGINHSTGKNLIGSFYQPLEVISDIHFLTTLPDNEWINGLSEILKYGAISDEKIFEDSKIFLNGKPSDQDSDKLISLIDKCVKIKAEIVGKDELESGVRAYLNYGHTFAHALEKVADFSEISHGEAVFLGMLAAEKLSVLTGSTLKTAPLNSFRNLYKYRVPKEALSLDDLMETMNTDKKRTGANLTFILLNKWQEPIVKTVEDREWIASSWSVVFDEIERNRIT